MYVFFPTITCQDSEAGASQEGLADCRRPEIRLDLVLVVMVEERGGREAARLRGKRESRRLHQVEKEGRQALS